MFPLTRHDLLAPHLPLTTRLYAWWEGYDIDALRERCEYQPRPDPFHPLPPLHKPGGLSGGKAGLKTGEHDRHGKPLWTANRIEVAEKIWGDGFVSPSGASVLPELLKPLGLNPSMSVLDLAAGLGGVGRMMVRDYGVWVSGLEASPILAEEGMARSIKAGLAKRAPVSHYNPEHFDLHRRFDAVFAKENFFQVKNKEGLVNGFTACLKPRGQLTFTDYVVPANPQKPDILLTWIQREPQPPTPWTVDAWVHCLRRHQWDVRICEDITASHRHLIVEALAHLQVFLEEHSLDQATKTAVLETVELWARREEALRHDLRCYRFYALREH